jgi:hypothetical protein
VSAFKSAGIRTIECGGVAPARKTLERLHMMERYINAASEFCFGDKSPIPNQSKGETISSPISGREALDYSTPKCTPISAYIITTIPTRHLSYFCAVVLLLCYFSLS